MDKELAAARRYEPIPENPTMGPAMRALSPQQRAFVVAYAENGVQNATLAAKQAGYGEDSPTPEMRNTAAKQAGYRHIHDDRVLAALKELAQARLNASAFHATNVLIEIADDPTHKDRLKAAEILMNRAGMIVVNEQKITVEHKVEGRSAILKRIEALAAKNGLNPQALMERRIQDAEVVEVKSLPAPEEPAMSSEGLEDLL